MLEKEYKHKIAFTINEVSQVCNISERNIRTRLEELKKAGLLDKRRAHKTAGDKYVYVISKFGIDLSQGFTAINETVLGLFLEAVDKKIINETVLKFMIYMKHVAKEGRVLSQEGIAKQLNIKQEAVSKLWAKVEELNATRKYPYIIREKLWLDKDKDKHSYYYEVKY